MCCGQTDAADLHFKGDDGARAKSKRGNTRRTLLKTAAYGLAGSMLLPVSQRSGFSTETSSPPEAASQVRDQFEQHYNNSDASAVADLFTTDARFLPAGNPTLRGRAEIEAYYADFFRQMESQRIAITPAETRASGELVYEWGTYEVTSTPQGGEQTTNQGRYTVVLERQDDDSYRIVLDADNSSQSPAS